MSIQQVYWIHLNYINCYVSLSSVLYLTHVIHFNLYSRVSVNKSLPIEFDRVIKIKVIILNYTLL